MSTTPSPQQEPASIGLTWLACLAALGTSAGSLWLSLKMDLVACPLCFYQRTFAFGAAAVLLIGLLFGAGRRTALSLLALPLAAGGLGVAGFHVYLERSGILECPAGIHDIGTAPKQSFAAFTVLLVLLLADVAGNRRAVCCPFLAAVVGLALGGACAYGCIISGPKLPEPPTKPYDPTKPINTCRRPYKAPE
jgi:disulfide bond formation protein DsbB